MNISNLDAERQQLILNSALKEFATRGYDNASTNQISKNAGISKALMFHYIDSKEELFLYLISYCQNKINTEYLERMDFTETDIFKRLQQSFTLQITLLIENPWIFDFNKLSTATKSERINLEIKKQLSKDDPLCIEKIFDGIDETRFLNNLSIDRHKELIYSSVLGLSNQILNDFRVEDYNNLNFNALVESVNDYFHDLSTIFYSRGNHS